MKDFLQNKLIYLPFVIQAIMIAASIFLVYQAYAIQMLPIFILSLVLLIAIALNTLFIYIFCRCFHNFSKKLLFAILGSLVISFLLFYGGNILAKTNKTLDEITTTSIQQDRISLIIHRSSQLSYESEELDLLVYQPIDEETVEEVKNNLTLNIDNTLYFDDIVDIMKEFNEDKFNMILINNSYIDLINELYPDFISNISIISSFIPMEEEKEEVIETIEEEPIIIQPFSLYISGMDSVGTPDMNLRSDVNMLLLVDPVNHELKMISIPRDAYVPNASLYNRPDKLTHTGLDGISNTIQTMSNVFGFEIDYYAKVSFSSLIEIVDKLGGIQVDVQIDFCEQDENRSFAADDVICLNKGVQTLNGKQALAYARHRHTSGYGDFGRTKAQQDIIKGIINKALSVEGMSRIDDVLQILPDIVQTNMPSDLIKQIVKSELENIRPWEFTSKTLSHGVGANLPTASMGNNTYLYVNILNKEEVMSVFDSWEAIQHVKDDLNEEEKKDYEYVEAADAIWSDNYTTKTWNYFTSLPKEEEPSIDTGEPIINPDGPMVPEKADEELNED